MGTVTTNVNLIISATNRASAVVDNITKRIQQNYAKLQTTVDKYYAAMEKTLNTDIVGDSMIRAGKQMNDALLGPIKAAMNLESAMAEVRKVVDFKDGESGAAAFQRKLAEMSRVIPIATTGLAAIAAAGGQLGIAEGDLGTFTEIVAKMSTAFDMLPDEAGDAFAKLSNIYKLNMEQGRLLGDAINHLSNNTAAKAGEIVNAVSRMGGVAKNFGLTEIQASALADAMIALGKAPDIAARGMNAMMSKMQAATIQGNNFQEGLQKIGISAQELESMIADNAQGALLEFLKAVEQLDTGDRTKALGQMFGAEWGDDLSLLVNSLSEYEKALNLVGDQANYAGSMQREFEQRAKTTANNLQLLKNRFNRIAVIIGAVLLPPINKIFVAIGNVLDRLADWAEQNQGLVKTIVITFAAVSTGILALGVLTKAAGMAWVSFAALRVGIAAVGLGIPIMFNPIMSLISAVKYLAIAGVFLYANWEKIPGWLASFSDWAFSGGSVMQTFAQGIINSGTVVWNAIVGVLERVRGLFPFSPAKYGPLSTLDKAGPGLISVFAKGILGSRVLLFVAISQVLKTVLMTLSSSGALSEMMRSGGALWEAFAGGLANAGQVVRNAIVGVFNYIRALFPFSPAKAGPLSELPVWGENFWITFAGGMKRGARHVWASITGVFSGIRERLSGFFEGMLGTVGAGSMEGLRTHMVNSLAAVDPKIQAMTQALEKIKAAGGDLSATKNALAMLFSPLQKKAALAFPEIPDISVWGRIKSAMPGKDSGNAWAVAFFGAVEGVFAFAAPMLMKRLLAAVFPGSALASVLATSFTSNPVRAIALFAGEFVLGSALSAGVYQAFGKIDFAKTWFDLTKEFTGIDFGDNLLRSWLSVKTTITGPLDNLSKKVGEVRQETNLMFGSLSDNFNGIIGRIGDADIFGILEDTVSSFYGWFKTAPPDSLLGNVVKGLGRAVEWFMDQTMTVISWAVQAGLQGLWEYIKMPFVALLNMDVFAALTGIAAIIGGIFSTLTDAQGLATVQQGFDDFAMAASGLKNSLLSIVAVFRDGFTGTMPITERLKMVFIDLWAVIVSSKNIFTGFVSGMFRMHPFLQKVWQVLNALITFAIRRPLTQMVLLPLVLRESLNIMAGMRAELGKFHIGKDGVKLPSEHQLKLLGERLKQVWANAMTGKIDLRQSMALSGFLRTPLGLSVAAIGALLGAVFATNKDAWNAFISEVEHGFGFMFEQVGILVAKLQGIFTALMSGTSSLASYVVNLFWFIGKAVSMLPRIIGGVIYGINRLIELVSTMPGWAQGLSAAIAGGLLFGLYRLIKGYKNICIFEQSNDCQKRALGGLRKFWAVLKGTLTGNKSWKMPCPADGCAGQMGLFADTARQKAGIVRRAWLATSGAIGSALQKTFGGVRKYWGGLNGRDFGEKAEHGFYRGATALPGAMRHAGVRTAAWSKAAARNAAARARTGIGTLGGYGVRAMAQARQNVGAGSATFANALAPALGAGRQVIRDKWRQLGEASIRAQLEWDRRVDTAVRRGRGGMTSYKPMGFEERQNEMRRIMRQEKLTDALGRPQGDMDKYFRRTEEIQRQIQERESRAMQRALLAGQRRSIWDYMFIGADAAVRKTGEYMGKIKNAVVSNKRSLSVAAMMTAAGLWAIFTSPPTTAATLDTLTGQVTEKLSLFDTVSAKLNQTWEFLKQNWMEVLMVLSMLGIEVVPLAISALMWLGGAAWSGIAALASTLSSLLAPAITALTAALAPLVSSLLPLIAPAVALAAAAFAGWEFGKWVYSNFSTEILDAIDAVVGLIASIPEKVNAAVSAIGNLQTGIADKAGRGFENILSAVTFGAFKTTDELAQPEIDGKKAAGGPVGAGKTYLVGEKGPELFTPGHAGRIVPNNQIAGGGGGGGRQTTISIGDVIVNVQGGGDQFDPVQLGRMVRDEIRLAIDEATRRSMFDI